MLGERVSIFISYSQDDEVWRDRLEAQLAPLVKAERIHLWDVKKVTAGDDLRARIDKAIADARVALFLVSASFNASSAIQDHELPALFGRHSRGGLRLMPILVRPVDVEAVPWLARLRCFPHDGVALSMLQKARCEAALAAIAGEIRGLLPPPFVLPIPGLVGTGPWQPRRARGALRVLAIGPRESSRVALLRSALEDRIASGEIDWLAPVGHGGAPDPPALQRLQQEPRPHVLHLFGAFALRGASVIFDLGPDQHGAETTVDVAALAERLESNFSGDLRLVVLEPTAGAAPPEDPDAGEPSPLARAAEILCRSGADAVVVHHRRLGDDAARTCSEHFYRELCGADRPEGDVVLGLRRAHQALSTQDAADERAPSPVAYLRGPEGVLFDFKDRKTTPPAAKPPARRAMRSLLPAVERLSARPFALLLGDRLREQRPAIEDFRAKLGRGLAGLSLRNAPVLPMSTLAERFSLHRGAARLDQEFQKAFHDAAPRTRLMETLARLVGPGVHTTLLRHPWLEEALAALQPDRTIYVIVPDEQSTSILRREGGSSEWEALAGPPAAIDPTREIILLRPYGGYTAERVFSRPLLTEDDYHLGLREIEHALPRDLANVVLRTLTFRPALLLGVSLHTAHHRMLLRRLYPRGVPRGSLAIVDPEEGERPLWEKGAGLPGKSDGVEVVESLADIEAEEAS